MASASSSLLPAVPRGRVALHADLRALLAKPPAERKRSVAELYSLAIPEYVSALLSRGEHNEDTLERLGKVIASLDEHRVYTDLTSEQRASLARQLSQQCTPLTSDYIGDIYELCSALSAEKYDYEVVCSVAVPVVRAGRLQESESLLWALFERGEWLNASRHLFVVPLLVGSAREFDQLDASVREFCVRLEDGDGALAMGSVARELLQVHAERSVPVATQCVRLMCEWGAVWDALHWTAKSAMENKRAAELSQRARLIEQVTRSDQWRSTQRDLLIALVRCNDMWTHPIADTRNGTWTLFGHKFIQFGFSNMYLYFSMKEKIRQIGTMQETSEAARLLVQSLINVFEFCTGLMDSFLQRDSNQLLSHAQQTFLEKLSQIPLRKHSQLVNWSEEQNAATRLLSFWTAAVRMQCEYAKDAAGLRTVNSALCESLLRLPLARYAAQTMRSCVQCCTVWSLLESNQMLAEALADTAIDAGELVHVMDSVRQMIESDEWRSELRRNITSALDIQELWRWRPGSNWHWRYIDMWEFLRSYFPFTGTLNLPFEIQHRILDQLVHMLKKRESTRYLHVLLRCVGQLFEFGVQLIEGCARDARLQYQSFNEKVPDDAFSGPLVKFVEQAVRFQEQCSGLGAQREELFAIARIPLRRCLPQAFRIDLEHCTIWSLLDQLTSANNESGIYDSEHWYIEALNIVRLKLESDEWRIGVRRNLHAVRSIQILWRYPIEDEARKRMRMNPPSLELCCFLFEENTEPIDRISGLVKRKAKLSDKMRSVVFCVYKLLEFGVELIADLGTSEHSELVADQRVQHELDNIAVNEHEICFFEAKDDKCDWNASTRLLDFCVAAVRMQCTFAEESAFAVEFVWREQFLRLPLARCAAQALRYCVQCCSVWSLLERSAQLAECLTDTSQSLDELVGEVKSIVRSEKWRADVKCALSTALSEKHIWLFGTPYSSVFSALWSYCFLFDGKTRLFDMLQRSLLIGSFSGQYRYVESLVLCVCECLEFAVDLVEQSGLSIAHQLSNATVNESLRRALRGIDLEEGLVVLYCDEFPYANCSTLILEFLTKAISLQKRCRDFAAQCPAAEALAAVRLTRCLPHALLACLRCCPALNVLQWVTEWERRSQCVALAMVEALSDALQSPEWRVGQQKVFAAALSNRDLWRFPVIPQFSDYSDDSIGEATLNRLCFLCNMPDDYPLAATIERMWRAPPTIRTRLLQLVRALLEFGLQLMRRLRSPDDDDTPPAELDAPVFQWDPKCIKLDESPEPYEFRFLSSASTQLVDFWVTALESKLLACEHSASDRRTDSDSDSDSDAASATDRRALLALRLCAQAMLTGLLYEQLDDTRASASAVHIFDFRYLKNIRALVSLLEQNLRTLTALEAEYIEDMAQLTERPEVEHLYKRTMRLLWTLTYPVQLMTDTKSVNKRQERNIEELKAKFECVFTITKLVNELRWSIQLPTDTFFNLYLSKLKEGICEIKSHFISMKQLFLETTVFDYYDYEEIWASYMKQYNNVLNQFYHQTLLDDYSLPFTVPSLVFPCLILSRHELPCVLTSIHRTQLHDEAVLFQLSGRDSGANGTAATGAASSASAQAASVPRRTRKKRNKRATPVVHEARASIGSASLDGEPPSEFRFNSSTSGLTAYVI